MLCPQNGLVLGAKQNKLVWNAAQSCKGPAAILTMSSQGPGWLLLLQVVFADVAQPDQARIVGLNAQYFLKNGGHFVISIKASCIDSTAPPEAVFAR
jgi:hypothetical protein